MITLNSFFHSIRYALDTLHYEGIFLKVKQYIALDSILQGHDTIAVLPTGYGKSIIFHLLPFICDHININKYGGLSSNNAVLVISPLNSLINDQIIILQNRGVDAVVLNSSLVGDAELRGNTTENEEDEEHVINKSKFVIDTVSQERLEKRKFNLVYAHLESFISCEEGRQLLMSSTFQERISTIVIDQRRNNGLPTMHCISLLFTITIFNEHLAKSC
jgi:superfamily II DNA helicase RecQ